MGWSPCGCGPKPHVALVLPPRNRHANPRILEEASLSLVSVRLRSIESKLLGESSGERVERKALPELVQTDRLRLRPWELGDVDDVFSYAQDEEWARFLRILPRPYLRRHAEEFIARQILMDRVTHVAWAVLLEDAVVGGINVRFDFSNRLGELGYSIARAHWNQGYGTEAAKAVIDAAFSTHEDLNRIRAMADSRNEASQRVMEKVGMKREGVLRQNRVERGEPLDEAWFGILRSEWLK
jgi:[ribosomal protein S5]-alanine N-acetyltransferase